MVEDKRAQAQSLRDGVLASPWLPFSCFSLSRGSKIMTDDVYKKQIGGDHYSSMPIQASEFINKNNIPFAEGNAIKYLCRHKAKGQKQDLLKAIHYVEMAIKRDYD